MRLAERSANRVAERGSTEAEVSGDGWPFPLPSGYYDAANFSPVITFPRPDAETNSWAYHRKPCNGIEWSIPICVSGGSWPFKFELIQGPSGMVIGSYLDSGPGVYGTLSWPNPTDVGAPHTVEVRVTDQEQSVQSVTFTVIPVDPDGNPSTTDVYFVDSSVAPGGDGSLSDPYNALTSLPDDSTIQCYLREGSPQTNVSLIDHGAGAYITNNPACAIFVGYPGESPVLEWGARTVVVRSNDCFFANVECYNVSELANGKSQFFNLGSTSATRSTFFKVILNTVVAPSSSDSYQAQFILDGGVQYISISHVQFKNLQSGNHSCVEAYNSDRNVFEEIVIDSSCANARGIWLKGWSVDYNSVRRVKCLNSQLGTSMVNLQMTAGGQTPFGTYCETCWCLWHHSNLTGRGKFRMNGQSSGGGPSYGTRCSIRHDTECLQASADPPVMRNCAYNGDAGEINFRIVHTECSGGPDGSCCLVVDANSESIFDTDGKLTGTYRTNYLGRLGYEVTDGAARVYDNWWI